MRRLLLVAAAFGCVTAAAVLTTANPDRPPEPAAGPKFNVTSENKNPWTGLTPNVSPKQFQFAVVSDRTGGHRKGVFSKAVQQVNLLQPEFVMSVGDLIEGSANADTNRKQWDEFDGYAKQFKMPFFYCPGNHDFGNPAKNDVWKERLGRAYYHFTYKDCLFVVLNSNDAENAVPPPPGGEKQAGPRVGIGKAQQDYLAAALKENANARWTFVFLHHPVWAGRDITNTGWLEVEKLLAGRNHNVFCGHVHVFRKFLRNGTQYYQLATTGGGSAMRGTDYGEFDQIAWVTMTDDAPVIAHIGLHGVYKDDLVPFESDEDGAVARADATLADVTGTVTLDGKPAAGLQVVFHEIPADGKTPPKQPDGGSVRGAPGGRVTPEGTFTAYQFRGVSGLKPGKYAVTFEPAVPLVVDGKQKDNPVPEKYRAINTTPFRVEVKSDARNKFEFKLEG
jgi:hypothetical protein